MGTKVDRTGQRFGLLVAIEDSGLRSKKGAVLWRCRCDCGKEALVNSYSLGTGDTRSCGCLQRNTLIERNKTTTRNIPTDRYATRGVSRTRLYRIWNDMKQRCQNPRNSGYGNYGGRGIRVCNEWLGFPAFYNWAHINGYSDSLTIDRIDNDGNYEPANCRWATRAEQSRNTRRNVMIKGVCLAERCRERGLNYGTVNSRITRLGWSIEKALKTPVDEEKAWYKRRGY